MKLHPAPYALLLCAAALLAGCATRSPAPAASAAPAAAAAPTYDHTEPLGAAMEGWAYPFPVQHLQFELEGRPVRMAYMDVQPTAAPNGQTVVLSTARTSVRTTGPTPCGRCPPRATG